MNLNRNEDILESIVSSDNWIAWVLNNEVEVRWSSVAPSASKILVMRASEGYSNCQEFAIWQEDIPITQTANTTFNLTRVMDPGLPAGKFYLQATLLSGTGQVIARSEYPFLVIEGGIVLRFDTDKNWYRPGETVTMGGEATNLSSIEVSGLTAEILDMYGRVIYSETFDLPPYGTHAFTYTTAAGPEGTYPIDLYLVLDRDVLAYIVERYDVEAPHLEVS